MNLKKLTYKNWKEGIHKISPLQLCDARIAGCAGTIVGCVLSFIPLVLTKSWGYMVIIFFVGWLQVAALLGEIQQRKILKEAEQQISEAIKQMEAMNKVN